MDDEGMEPQRTVLIENGVLKRFISDRAGEMRTGHARTGSGVAKTTALLQQAGCATPTSLQVPTALMI